MLSAPLFSREATVCGVQDAGGHQAGPAANFLLRKPNRRLRGLPAWCDSKGRIWISQAARDERCRITLVAGMNPENAALT